MSQAQPPGMRAGLAATIRDGGPGPTQVVVRRDHEAGMDFERARFNMVEQQIRTWEVLDQEVLDLLFAVRREDFVPGQYRSLAFVDMEIPLAEHATAGEKMLAPKLEARMLQELAVKGSDRVLE